MVYKEYGDEKKPTIIMLHGGGLSWWSLTPIVEGLKFQYHIITPVIDGHGENGDTIFVSIEDYAAKLMRFIDEKFNGKIFALYGLSIGAQIVTEVLSQRKDITDFSIIESALVYPIKGTKVITVPMFHLCYGFLKRRWFARLQAKSLFVPEDKFEQYYQDSLKLKKQSLIHIALSNGNYKVKDSIKDNNAKTLIIVGEKELKIMRKSAEKLHSMIPNSRMYLSKNRGHGEISLVHAEEFIGLVNNFLKG